MSDNGCLIMGVCWARVFDNNNNNNNNKFICIAPYI